jgi:hypothetical protein
VRFIGAEEPDHEADMFLQMRRRYWMQLSLLPLYTLKHLYFSKLLRAGQILRNPEDWPVKPTDYASEIVRLEDQYRV